MMNMVNGFPCRDCADAELAKRGIDPLHPKPLSRGSEAASASKADKLGENAPSPSGVLGTKLNLLA